jgi:hypothetical protein
MHCPACGHAQLVARSCDECGVVFADYNRRMRAEREAAATPVARPAPPSRPSAARGDARQSSSSDLRRPPVDPRPGQDIHARKDDGWHDNWVDDGDELPTEQYHVNLFMGQAPGSVRLAGACQRMMLGRRTHLGFSWVGGAFLSPFLWAMYRKMWAWGTLIFVAEIVLPVLLISLGLKADISDKLLYLGLAGIVLNRLFWPLIAKYLYCRHARSTIASMHRASPTYASDIDIATAGGTSRTSVFVGVVLAIVASLLTWNVVDTVHARMLRAAPVFAEPPAAPAWTHPGKSTTTPGLAPSGNQASMSNENKWVMTRNKLRVLGQRLNAWFGSAGKEVDPARLSMADIGQSLLLDFDATLDGWGKQITYRHEGKGYVLISAGPDGQFDTTDDVKYRRSLSR